MKAEEGGSADGFYSDTEPCENQESSGETRAEESTSSGEQSVWKWRGQPIGQKSIDEDKKKQALAACSAQHATLVSCLRKGFTADCSETRKAFWDCYAEHRGVRGNKIAAWFAPPSLFGAQKHDSAAQDSNSNQHS